MIYRVINLPRTSVRNVIYKRWIGHLLPFFSDYRPNFRFQDASKFRYAPCITAEGVKESKHHLHVAKYRNGIDTLPCDFDVSYCACDFGKFVITVRRKREYAWIE